MSDTKDGQKYIFKPNIQDSNLPIDILREKNLIDSTLETHPLPDKTINEE